MPPHRLSRARRFDRSAVMTLLLRAAVPLGVVATAITCATAAVAKVTYDSPYGFDRTWNASIRLVRVDLGLKVTEKDEATGYLLFDYKSTEAGAKATPGSIELIRGATPDAPVRVSVQLAQMPKYHEQVLVEELMRKLRQEYGEPATRAKASPVVGPDAGT